MLHRWVRFKMTFRQQAVGFWTTSLGDTLLSLFTWFEVGFLPSNPHPTPAIQWSTLINGKMFAFTLCVIF